MDSLNDCVVLVTDIWLVCILATALARFVVVLPYPLHIFEAMTPRKSQNYNDQAWIFCVVSDPFQAETKTKGIVDTLLSLQKRSTSCLVTATRLEYNEFCDLAVS